MLVCDESMPTFDKPKWCARGAVKNTGRKFFSKELNSNASAQIVPFLIFKFKYLSPVASARQTTTPGNRTMPVGLSLVRQVERVEVNLELTSLTSRFLPFTKHHGDSIADPLTPSVLSLLPSSHASVSSNPPF
jgi:hypothetical protein